MLSELTEENQATAQQTMAKLGITTEQLEESARALETILADHPTDITEVCKRIDATGLPALLKLFMAYKCAEFMQDDHYQIARLLSKLRFGK